MADFRSLDPEIRCYALVGQFLQAWSLMELALRDAIGAALKVEPIPLQIVCANLHFRDKTDILRTLVDVSSLPEAERQRAKSKLRKLGNRATRRNMLAHAPFLADEPSDGVKFLTVRARGEYETPAVIWSVHKFEEEGRALQAYARFLDCLEKRFKEKPLTERNYVDALRPFLDRSFYLDQSYWDTPMPMRHRASSALLTALSLPDQSRLDSDQATPKTLSQSPSKPD